MQLSKHTTTPNSNSVVSSHRSSCLETGSASTAHRLFRHEGSNWSYQNQSAPRNSILPPCLPVLASSFSISKSADIIAPRCHQFHLLLEIEVNSIIVSCNCRPQSPSETSDRRGLGGVGRRKSILRFYPELPHSAPHRRTTNCVDIYSPWRRQAEE